VKRKLEAAYIRNTGVGKGARNSRTLIMKTKSTPGLGGLLALVTLAAAFFIQFNAVAADVTAKGAASKFMELKTVGDIEALKPGDVVVMACAKCKTITETRIEHPPKGAGSVETVIPIHTCPGCGAKWETVGHGKAKTDKVTHICSHCGKEAFCAVKKANAPGAEEEKK
jgi:hypothetical protein